MSDLLVKPVAERFDRLTRALQRAKALYGSPPARWENECEAVFSEFRVSCVHLRRDAEKLDEVEDKAAAWRFICKFCRERPFWHDRCSEVLRILMKSDVWMKEFTEDPDVNPDDLPPGILEEFKKRQREVEPDKPQEQQPPPPRGPSDPTGAKGKGDEIKIVMPERPAGMHVVVQRCVKAKILADETAGSWAEIGRGLVVSVSFGRGCKQDAALSAARFLLTAKLSTADRWEPGKQVQEVDSAWFMSKSDESIKVDVTVALNQLIARNGAQDVTARHSLIKVFGDIAPRHLKKLVVRAGVETAEFLEHHGGGPMDKVYNLSRLFARRRSLGGGVPESVASLCRSGEEQGILVMRQASLSSHLGEDLSLDYQGRAGEDEAAAFYEKFVKALETIGAELVAAPPPPDAPAPVLPPCAPRVVAGAFDGRGYLEMVSAGPFMHSFNF